MNPRYYLRLSNTVVGSATAQIIGQRIEDVRTLAGQQCTLSAWIKGTATGITAKAVQNFGTGGSPSSAVTTTLGTATPTTSWVRLHVHFTMPSLSGKTIGTNENSFVEIQFDCGASLGTLDLWGVQLEQNTTQTAFEQEPIQQTLAKCQRYHFRMPNNNVYMRFSLGDVVTVSMINCQIPNPVDMRVTPSAIEISSFANYAVYSGNVVTALNNLYLDPISSPRMTVVLGTIATTVLVVGRVAQLISNNNGNAYFGVSAEL